MNKKGFTLIELLTIIILLAVIATLSFKIVTTSINEAKERSYNTLIARFKVATKKYLLEQDVDPEMTNQLCISLKELQNKGYLETKPIKNPKTGEKFNLDNVGMSAKFNDSTKQYDLQLYVGGNCTQVTNQTTLYSKILDTQTIAPSSGDGLYETNDSYVFKGSNPNNYIWLNETNSSEKTRYRIVSLNKDDKLIKIVDTTGDNTSVANLTAAVDTTFKSKYNSFMDKIAENAKWNSGNITDLSSYKSVLSQEKMSNSYQTISLLTLSDYIGASLNSKCYKSNNCNSYLKLSNSYWLVTSSGSGYHWYVNSSTGAVQSVNFNNYTYRKNPAFYLNEHVQFKSGDGSATNPYTLN